MDSLSFLERSARAKVQPIYVLHGDDAFLKRQVLLALRSLVLGPESDGFGQSAHAGDKATFAAVSSDLATLPFLSPRRLVIVENADPFVSRERKKLEKYADEPCPTGILVLDVTVWQATTNLAKQLTAGLITCNPPPAARLPEWCQKWCTTQQGKHLSQPAARLLVDLVGADMGRLDQELAKLALYVGEAAKIDTSDVDRLVGNSREEKVWKLFDLIGLAQPAAALVHLDRLLVQGEEPMRLLGAFSTQLRHLAQAARLNSQGVSLSSAMDQAGVPPYPAARQGAEQQMRHLGKRRLDQLFDWLLQTDLGMKGSSQLPPRTLLEKLVVQLARANPSPKRS
jgi:DNA polymerase-3 subunit delta